MHGREEESSRKKVREREVAGLVIYYQAKSPNMRIAEMGLVWGEGPPAPHFGFIERSNWREKRTRLEPPRPFAELTIF